VVHFVSRPGEKMFNNPLFIVLAVLGGVAVIMAIIYDIKR